MSNMPVATVAWRLEDFNYDGNELQALPGASPQACIEAEPQQDLKTDPWIEGYMHAARHAIAPAQEFLPKAGLAGALQQIEDGLRQSTEATSALIAHLLLNATAAIGMDRWSDLLPERIQRMAQAVKPALLATLPEISLHSANGEIVLRTESLDNLEATPVALAVTDTVVLSWKQGRAEASRMAAMQEIASALAPLVDGVLHADPNPLDTGAK